MIAWGFAQSLYPRGTSLCNAVLANKKNRVGKTDVFSTRGKVRLSGPKNSVLRFLLRHDKVVGVLALKRLRRIFSARQAKVGADLNTVETYVGHVNDARRLSLAL